MTLRNENDIIALGSDNMTKIDLITGILGSGKTTFLLRYARELINRGEKIAILENDFGAVNVDMMMLQELKGENCTIEMIVGGGDSGCHKRRFKTQLISLGMQHFDRVIVEPSGIFDMDEFFDTLYESPLDRWFAIGSILTMIDAQMNEVMSEQMEYLLASEAAYSGKLILSKQGLVDEPVEKVSARVIAHLNRALALIRCDRRFSESDLFAKEWDELESSDYDEFFKAGYRGASYVKQFPSDDINSEVHYFMHVAVPQDKIEETVGAIMNDPECGRIFRIKGSLPSDDGGWLKINATSEKTEISRVVAGQGVLIAIGDNISRERIDSHLRAVNTNPKYISI